MTKYAEKTTVSSDKSRAEIEKTLSRYGASSFLYGWNDGSAMIMFEMNDRRIKFVLPIPDKGNKEFISTPSGRKRRSPEQVEQAYEQAVRQKWRALNLVIKAKLEAVEAGITIFEKEFLAHVVLPDGSTVSDFMIPQIELAYQKGSMPKMLSVGK
ncbi:hypothetical protein KAR91_31155 [Candidatus Pacearchaeota archaeon]|nr:hypothetical protein [Candidatus Pacearchaeota archaeon]